MYLCFALLGFMACVHNNYVCKQSTHTDYSYQDVVIMFSRALKTKHDTPKYGLIYHASLVGQTAPKNKGKISRMLAAKASLCVRVDALSEDSKPAIGKASRAMVEERVRQCEQEQLRKVSGTGKARARAEKYEMKG